MHTFSINGQTQTAGTAIVDFVPPAEGLTPRITEVTWTAVTTAQTVVCLRPVAQTTIDGGVVSGTAIDIADTEAMYSPNTPGTRELIAANDYVVYQTDIGYEYNSVASVSANTVTLNTAIGDRIKDGAAIWLFGEVGRASHPTAKISVGNSIPYFVYWQAGIPAETDTANVRTGVGDPLIIYCSNVTTASTLNAARGEYIADGSQTLT